MEQKQQLAQLYAQKGELITNIELMQAQLRNVNERIVELKNAERKQQSVEEKGIDKSEKQS